MALFGKKKQENEYLTAQNQMNQQPATKANERIHFAEITADDDHTLYLVKKMMNHQPLVLNFERVDVPTANKVLAFLAGAILSIFKRGTKIGEQGRAVSFCGTAFYIITSLLVPSTLISVMFLFGAGGNRKAGPAAGGIKVLGDSGQGQRHQAD